MEFNTQLIVFVGYIFTALRTFNTHSGIKKSQDNYVKRLSFILVWIVVVTFLKKELRLTYRWTNKLRCAEMWDTHVFHKFGP